MGVPGFFLWLMKNYKKTNFVFSKNKLNDNNELIEEINNIDTLLIDANCLIHPTCFKVVAEHNNITDSADEELEKELYKLTKKEPGIKGNRNFEFTFPADTLIIFDEAHRCKNFKSITSKMLISMKNNNVNKNKILD